MAISLPLAVLKSAITSAFLRSIPITLSPLSSIDRRKDAPIPEALPVIAIVLWSVDDI